MTYKTRQRTGGEALRCCWPWCCQSGTRARENSSEAERTRIQFTAQGPPAGPWGAPAVSCARTTPDRSDWSRQCEPCSEQPSSRLRSRIWMSLRTPWQRVGAGGGGRAPLSIQLTMCSSPCQPQKTSHPCCNICYALLIVGIARVATSAQSCELCGGPRAVQVASLACWHG